MDPVQGSAPTPAPGSAPAPSAPVSTTPEVPEVASPHAVTQPAPAPAGAVSAPAAPEPKVLAIPSAAMKGIKADERERGRAEALQSLEVEAQSLGFSTYAELKAAAAAQKAGAQAAPVPEPASADTGQNLVSPAQQELVAQRDRALDEKKRLNRQHARAERENRQLKQKLIEQEVQSELKLAAKDAGVVDVDYAVEVLRRSIKGMSETELQGFDEAKFFREQLRQSHPHLYQVEQRPVTTGTGNAPVAKPTVPSKTVDPKDAGKADARVMSPQDFQARLRKLGLSDPATGGMLA